MDGYEEEEEEEVVARESNGERNAGGPGARRAPGPGPTERTQTGGAARWLGNEGSRSEWSERTWDEVVMAVGRDRRRPLPARRLHDSPGSLRIVTESEGEGERELLQKEETEARCDKKAAESCTRGALARDG